MKLLTAFSPTLQEKYRIYLNIRREFFPNYLKNEGCLTVVHRVKHILYRHFPENFRL